MKESIKCIIDHSLLAFNKSRMQSLKWALKLSVCSLKRMWKLFPPTWVLTSCTVKIYGPAGCRKNIWRSKRFWLMMCKTAFLQHLEIPAETILIVLSSLDSRSACTCLSYAYFISLLVKQGLLSNKPLSTNLRQPVKIKSQFNNKISDKWNLLWIFKSFNVYQLEKTSIPNEFLKNACLLYCWSFLSQTPSPSNVSHMLRHFIRDSTFNHQDQKHNASPQCMTLTGQASGSCDHQNIISKINSFLLLSFPLHHLHLSTCFFMLLFLLLPPFICLWKKLFTPPPLLPPLLLPLLLLPLPFLPRWHRCRLPTSAPCCFSSLWHEWPPEPVG